MNAYQLHSQIMSQEIRMFIVHNRKRFRSRKLLTDHLNVCQFGELDSWGEELSWFKDCHVVTSLDIEGVSGIECIDGRRDELRVGME